MLTHDYDSGLLEPMQLPKAALLSVLLVDDQELVAEQIRELLSDQPDLKFHYCSDPTKAIKMAEEVRPTVILQDLFMPDVEGLLLVRYFKANPATRDIPMIVLSGEEDAKIKAEAFAAGANDYLVKVPQKAELLARIRYHSDSYIRLIQRNEAYQRLEESQQALKRDLADAADYVKSILPTPLDEEHIKTSWVFIPSTSLGGDTFGYHWLDEDHFAIYLLDVCGHGVGAALLSTSVANVLRSQALPNTDFEKPDKVMEALNERFPMENNRNMFFTMWYGVYNRKRRELSYCTGGHPPAILVTGASPENVKTFRLRTQGLVVGGMRNSHYESATVTVHPFNRLYIFSDGVYEVFDKKGKILDLEQLIEILAQPTMDLDVKRPQELARSLNGPGPFPDDFSFLAVTFR